MASPTSTTPWKESVPSSDADIDALLGGTQYRSTSLTFSFAEFGSAWSTSASGYGPQTGPGEPWSDDFDVLVNSDRVAARAAMDTWEAVSGLQLTEVAETATVVGDLRLAYTWTPDMDDAQAYAFLPANGPTAGDIWFNTRASSHEFEWTPGSWEYMTAVHEIGHALGLKHPFEDPAISPGLDTRSFTVMSYSAQAGNQDTYFSYEPTTPMVLDIAAIQHLYGINTTTGAGNTNYQFTGTGDYHRTIWDAGGTDAIVYQSGAGGEIDLRSGIGGGSRLGKPLEVQDANGQLLYTTYNIWIAYGSVIENAFGGSGNDTIYGNEVGNRLDGGAGNDTITGFDGRDTLEGGTGSDSLIGGPGNDTYYIGVGSDRIAESGTSASEIDTVIAAVDWTLGSRLERLTLLGTAASDGTGNSLANLIKGNTAANALSGASGNDTINAGSGNDTLNGGSGHDTLNGGSGSDLLTGGSGTDRITGGSGADLFVLDSKAGSDTFTDFVSGSDDVRVRMGAIKVGDGDTRVEGAVTRGAPGGFTNASELVIFSNHAANLTTAAAAAAIGSATGSYTLGRTALFVVDDGASSGVYLFTAANTGALVSATELTLLGTLGGVTTTLPGDYLFGA